MQFPKNKGSAMVVTEDGSLKLIDYMNPKVKHSDSILVTIDDQLVNVYYDKNCHAYYIPLDDENTFSHQMAIYKEGQKVANPEELKASAVNVAHKLFHVTFIENTLSVDDLKYVMDTLISPALLHHEFNENDGDVEKAQKSFIAKIHGSKYV